MATFTKSYELGHQFEELVECTVREYTAGVFENIRVPTLHTEKGYTEIDVLAAIGGFIVCFECKNVVGITGDHTSDIFQFHSRSGQTYAALNPFTQNRIHQFAVCEGIARLYSKFPRTLSYIVIPDECECEITGKGADELVKLSELTQLLSALASTAAVPKEAMLLSRSVAKWEEALNNG